MGSMDCSETKGVPGERTCPSSTCRMPSLPSKGARMGFLAMVARSAATTASACGVVTASGGGANDLPALIMVPICRAFTPPRPATEMIRPTMTAVHILRLVVMDSDWMSALREGFLSPDARGGHLAETHSSLDSRDGAP